MSKKRGVEVSRGDSMQGLYKLRNELNQLGEMPQDDEFYDYVVKFLEVTSRFEDENFVRSFRAPILNPAQAKNFGKTKNIFMRYLEFFERGGKVNHTRWREEIKLENVYLMCIDNGKEIIKTAYEWKYTNKKHKEKHAVRIRSKIKSKMDGFNKSLNEFIKSFE